MEYIKNSGVIVARLDIDDEIVSCVEKICRECDIESARVHAIGAVKSATVAMFDFAKGDYNENKLDRFMELLSLEGNVTKMNGECYIHLHAAFGDSEGKAFGGHLKNAVIGATCEMFIEPLENAVKRVKDSETGLNIFDFRG